MVELYWIIYIVGFFATYIACKLARGKDEDNNGWNDIGITIILSFLSVIGLIILGIVGLRVFINNYLEERSELPKFLRVIKKIL